MKTKGLKVLLILSIVVMIVSACSGNGNNSSSSKNDNSSKKDSSTNSEVTKVVFWDLFSGNDGETMTAAVNEFNELHPNIEVEKITQEWGEYYTKLTTAVLGNKAPDLGVSHATRVLQLKHEGVIQPMDEEVMSAGIDWSEFSGTAVDVTTIEDQHYAVPLDYHAFLLFYNKKLLDDMGLLNAEGKPEFDGYDEFVTLLQKVKEQGSEINPLALRGAGTHPFRLWYSFYKQMGGGNIYNENEGKSSIDQEIGLKSLQAVSDLFNKYEVVPPQIKNIDEMFQSEKAAFMINGTWAVDNTYKALGDDLGVMPFPTFFDKQAVYADSHTFVLPTNPNRDQKKSKATMTFVKWMVDNGWNWSKAGHLPTTTKVLDSDELKEQPFRDNYKSEVEFMEFLPPTSKTWFANSSQLIEAMDGVWIKKHTTEEGLKAIEKAIQTELQ